MEGRLEEDLRNLSWITGDIYIYIFRIRFEYSGIILWHLNSFGNNILCLDFDFIFFVFLSRWIMIFVCCFVVEIFFFLLYHCSRWKIDDWIKWDTFRFSKNQTWNLINNLFIHYLSIKDVLKKKLKTVFPIFIIVYIM